AAGTVPAIGEIRVLPTAVDAALVKFAAENPDLVEYLPKYGMVKIKADMTFAKGSAEVTAAAAAALTKLAEIANSPDAKAFNVYIAGHTDDIPIRKAETLREHKNNWGLSVHRSLAVIKVLFQAGVDQKRMGAMGFSKYHPVEPNELGNRGNPTNRRVEIWLVPPNRFLTGSVAAEADK
ncbi:MAG: OmpA family protein, partial [Phycisphaerae bacterium]|nr:OmpA family protein [Phycisphaerae bacterium]